MTAVLSCLPWNPQFMEAFYLLGDVQAWSFALSAFRGLLPRTESTLRHSSPVQGTVCVADRYAQRFKGQPLASGGFAGSSCPCTESRRAHRTPRKSALQQSIKKMKAANLPCSTHSIIVHTVCLYCSCIMQMTASWSLPQTVLISWWTVRRSATSLTSAMILLKLPMLLLSR